MFAILAKPTDAGAICNLSINDGVVICKNNRTMAIGA